MKTFLGLVLCVGILTQTFSNGQVTGAGPTIRAVAYTNLSAYSAVFAWSTGADKSDSQVLCGANGGFAGGPYTSYFTQVSDPVRIGSSDYWGVTAHRLGVNLPASYSGHCVVRSTNQLGVTTTSDDQAVTTPAAPVNVPVGISSVSRRVNLTNGTSGYSGDIAFMAATADGEWIMQNNDSNGKAISSSQSCCDSHLLMSKWPTMTTRSMLLGQDNSMPGAMINNVFGTASGASGGNNWAILGGSCFANLATVTFEDRGYTIPAGTPVWVAGASPAGYNVSSVFVTRSTATSVTYMGTCGSTVWSGGGTVAIWHDGNHQFSFGIDSVDGLVCMTSFRSDSHNPVRICSTDYFAHSFLNGHNAPGAATTVPYIDAPLPSSTCFWGPACLTPAAVLQVVPCRDYGGANQNTFPCTWLGGSENYIYYSGTNTQITSGYKLYREAYADHRLVDGMRWEVYTCVEANDDRGLYNNCWSSDLTGGTVLNADIATYGNSFTIVTAADFNGFLGANWTALPGRIPTGNVSQSAGATIYDLGMWPWGTAAPIGSVNRDETDINYFPTWSFLVPASYTTISSTAPIRATVQLRQSGSYLNQSPNPSVNRYGPNLYTIGLADRGIVHKENVGPLFRPEFVTAEALRSGARTAFISNSLDLFYSFQDPSGTQIVTNSSPNDTTDAYKTVLPQTKIALYDRYGLFSPGFPVDGLYGGADTHGYPFFMTTPYAVRNQDFTVAVVFNHQDAASAGPAPGECVIHRSNLSICRSGSAANSWLINVGVATSGALPVTCDGGKNFCGVIIDRIGSTAKVYKTDNIRLSSPLIPLATINDGSRLANDALSIGAKSDGKEQFQGWISVLAYYDRSLSDTELQHFTDMLRKFEATRGIMLP
jgi:hypothetical protein